MFSFFFSSESFSLQICLIVLILINKNKKLVLTIPPSCSPIISFCPSKFLKLLMVFYILLFTYTHQHIGIQPPLTIILPKLLCQR